MRSEAIAGGPNRETVKTSALRGFLPSMTTVLTDFLQKQTKLFLLEKAGEVHTKYNFAWWLQVSKHTVVHSAMHARAEHGHRAAKTGQNGQPAAADGGGS